MAKVIIGFLLACLLLVLFLKRPVESVPFNQKQSFVLFLENVKRGNTCSAFFAKSSESSKIRIITAGHCVQKAHYVVITTSKKDIFIAKVLDSKLDSKNFIDWAVLSIDDLDYTPDPDSVLTINWNIKGSSFTWFSSINHTNPVFLIAANDTVFYIAGTVIPGDSGSPLIWHDNTVVGIVTFTFVGQGVGGGSNIKQVPLELFY